MGNGNTELDLFFLFFVFLQYAKKVAYYINGIVVCYDKILGILAFRMSLLTRFNA